jgi:hypothetical protein
MTTVTVCPTPGCKRLISYDPSGPDQVIFDTLPCMQCIFDEEEGHIVRGEK